MRVGLLALQGDFAEHLEAFSSLGVQVATVRRPEELLRVDALVIPGGESTTMTNLAARNGLFEALGAAIAGGLPVWGTCAGMILLAREVEGGEVPHLGALDLVVVRNAYGRQVDSFELDLEFKGVGEVRAVFIRAPVVREVGPEVEVLAVLDGRAVAVRQGRVLGTAFHPELTPDRRVHRFFLERVALDLPTQG